MKPLEILYRDQHLIAVNKPPGLLVHRTRIAEAQDFVLQRLRRQIGQRVYTAHRLDRPASGALLFGLSAEAGRSLSQLFENRLLTGTDRAIDRALSPDQTALIKAPSPTPVHPLHAPSA